MPPKRKRNDMDSGSSSSESGSDSDLLDGDSAPPAAPQAAPEPPAPVDEMWTVQRVTGHRGSGVLLEYLIVWDGNWPMDWNSVYNCDCEDAIADYWRGKSRADYNRAHEIKAPPKAPRKSAKPAQPRPRASTSAATPVAGRSKAGPALKDITPTSLKLKLTFAPAPPGPSKKAAPAVQPPKKRGRMSKVDQEAETLKVRMAKLEIARRSSVETEQGSEKQRAIEVDTPVVAQPVLPPVETVAVPAPIQRLPAQPVVLRVPVQSFLDKERAEHEGGARFDAAKPSFAPSVAVLESPSAPVGKAPVSFAEPCTTQPSTSIATPLPTPALVPSVPSTVQPTSATPARVPVHTPAAYSTTTGSASVTSAPTSRTSVIAVSLTSVSPSMLLPNPTATAPLAAIAPQPSPSKSLTAPNPNSTPFKPASTAPIAQPPSPVAADESFATTDKSLHPPSHLSATKRPPHTSDTDESHFAASSPLARAASSTPSTSSNALDTRFDPPLPDSHGQSAEVVNREGRDSATGFPIGMEQQPTVSGDSAPVAAEPSPRETQRRDSDFIVNEAAIGNVEFALDGKHLYQGMERVWSDPGFEWEDLVHTIHALSKEDDVVQACIIWNDFSYSWVRRDILRHRAPQKLIQFFERHTVLAR